MTTPEEEEDEFDEELLFSGAEAVIRSASRPSRRSVFSRKSLARLSASSAWFMVGEEVQEGAEEVREEEGEELFDTTVDEMLLYEMFGEDYDEVVEGMGREEREQLREELERRSCLTPQWTRCFYTRCLVREEEGEEVFDTTVDEMLLYEMFGEGGGGGGVV